MARTFDTATLGMLRDINEIRIRPGTSSKRGVIIWVVAVGDEVFVRSVQGPGGKWFKTVSAQKEATLEIGDRLIPATATPVAEKARLDAVSTEYLRKYATSPYAQSMTRPDTLPTTLRLEPK